jgi:hypothetical protein
VVVLVELNLVVHRVVEVPDLVVEAVVPAILILSMDKALQLVELVALEQKAVLEMMQVLEQMEILAM